MYSILSPAIPVALLDLLFAAIMLSLGVAAGWWLFRDRGGNEDNELESERALAALARVRELASSVAHDVGEHTSRVQEITTELNGKSSAGERASTAWSWEPLAQVVEANERLQAQLKPAEERLKQQAAEIQSARYRRSYRRPDPAEQSPRIRC